MILSLKLTGPHNIGVDSLNRINVNDSKLSVKDIPYVRYAFKFNAEEHTEYLKKNIEKFKYSVHIIDLELEDETASDISYIEETFNTENVDVSHIIKVNVSGEEVYNGKLADDTVEKLKKVLKVKGLISRVVLVDNDYEITDSSKLNPLVEEVDEILGMGKSNIGVCNSPILESGTACGVYGTKGCLPASVVRRMQEDKNPDIELPLVSENHQNSGTMCGCTKYHVVTGDIAATEVKKSGGTGKKGKGQSSSGEGKTKKDTRKSGPPMIF